MHHIDPRRTPAGRQRGKHGGGLWGIKSDNLREQWPRDIFGKNDNDCRRCFYANIPFPFILGISQGVVVDGKSGTTGTTADNASSGRKSPGCGRTAGTASATEIVYYMSFPTPDKYIRGQAPIGDPVLFRHVLPALETSEDRFRRNEHSSGYDFVFSETK
jgi:hypothetical protein